MKYRILEVEGITVWECRHQNKTICHDECRKIQMTGKYIPKYIVQENANETGDPLNDLWTVGKELKNLEEAKKYKRELELKNGGIVIE